MTDTIAAIATGQAAGGIGVVRISGGRAIEIADRVFTPVNGGSLGELAGYRARLGTVSDGDWSDECIALVFRAPHSYTGEDVVELSCHGGLVTTRCALEACLAAGARLAGPGEFTKRAYLSGKMSLDQAESVMAIINAGSRQAAKAAMRARTTRLAKRTDSLRSALTAMAARIAVCEDFPDEEDYELDYTTLLPELERVHEALSKLESDGRLGKVLREGIETIIIGKPNVGKSTLMNLLSGCERSIVTNVPGTTRDIVEEKVMIGDCPLLISDTAGLRDTDDPVEAIGVERARKRLESASLVLAVFDGSDELTGEDIEIIDSISDTPAIAIINKTDRPQVIDEERIRAKIPTVIRMSASSGEGAQMLEREILRITELEKLDPADNILTNSRQLECVRRAREFVALSAEDARFSGGMLGLYLRDAIDALGELTGESADRSIVDEVFDSFCVGK